MSTVLEIILAIVVLGFLLVAVPVALSEGTVALSEMVDRAVDSYMWTRARPGSGSRLTSGDSTTSPLLIPATRVTTNQLGITLPLCVNQQP